MAISSLPTLPVSSPGMAFTTPTASAGMGAAGYASIAGVGLSVAQSYFGAKAAASQYKIQEEEAKVAAARAKLQGSADALQLIRQYNSTQASNAVMAAAQGRSGESVSAVARAATSQLNWDMTFMKLSNDMSYASAIANAEGYATAYKTAKSGAIATAGASLVSGATKLYSIGGSTKGSN
jgi:hypothetical protein